MKYNTALTPPRRLHAYMPLAVIATMGFWLLRRFPLFDLNSLNVSTITTPDHQTVKIPRIFHQMWIGNMSQIPKASLASCERLHDTSAGWTYMLWTPERISEFAQSSDIDPEIANLIFDRMDIMQFSLTSSIPNTPGTSAAHISERDRILRLSDIWRLVILYHFGGVYVDSDSHCLKSFTPLTIGNDGFESFIGYESEKWRPGLRANGIQGSTPRAFAMHYALRVIHETNALRAEKLSAWQLTGPELSTTTGETLETTWPYTKLRNANGHKLGYKVYPSETFLPVHYTERIKGITAKEALARAQQKDSYLVHMWGSTRVAYKSDTPEDF